MIKERKLMVMMISTLFVLLPFNSITAQRLPNDSEELYEVKINLFGEEYSLSVTRNTLNKIEKIVDETSKKLSQVNGGIIEGLPVIVKGIKQVLELLPGLNYEDRDIQCLFKQSINKEYSIKNPFDFKKGNGIEGFINYFCCIAGSTEYASFCSIWALIAAYFLSGDIIEFFYPLLTPVFILPLAKLYYSVFLFILNYMPSNLGLFVVLVLLMSIPVLIDVVKSILLPIHIVKFLDMGILLGGWVEGWVSTLGFTGYHTAEGLIAGGAAGFTGLGLWMPTLRKAGFLGVSKLAILIYSD